MKTVRQTIDELYTIISQAEVAIDAIRKDCGHPNTEIKMYSWRVGSMQPAVICTECDFVVGMPTNDEIEAFYNKGTNL